MPNNLLINSIIFEKIVDSLAGLKRWQMEEKLWRMFYGTKSARIQNAIHQFAYANGLMLVEPSED